MMRDGLKYELGCEFPSVRVSTSPDHSAGAYTISIEEVQVVSGTLDLDRLLCNATVDQLKALDIKAEAAVNPANGNECAWTKLDQAAALATAGFMTWPPDEYLVLHLSAVLRKNAASLCRYSGRGGPALVAMRRYDDILAAPGGLPRFTDVIRGCSTTRSRSMKLRRSATAYLEVTELPTHEILEEIRALPVVNANLFWNKGEHQSTAWERGSSS